MRRSIAVAAFVIAAMAVGRAITDFVPTANVVATPFVHTGSIGRTVELEFARIAVTGVKVTPTITGNPAANAGGRWLVVETEMTATREPTFIALPTLIDSQERVHLPTDRAQDCRINASLATEVPWRVSFCFDVAQDALPGARVLFARGDYGDEGDGFRRDAVADVDLGISTAEAATLWGRTAPIDVKEDGIPGGVS